MKEDAVYLRHVLECIRRIEEDVACGNQGFLASHTYQDAVLRNLQTMAESTQKIPEERKAKRPEIEWRRIAAFRNLLVHNYLGVDLEKVWEIVQCDIPELKKSVTSMLSEEK